MSEFHLHYTHLYNMDVIASDISDFQVICWSEQKADGVSVQKTCLKTVIISAILFGVCGVCGVKMTYFTVQ